MILTKLEALKQIGAYRKTCKSDTPRSAFFSPEDLHALLGVKPAKGLRVFFGNDETGKLSIVGSTEPDEAVVSTVEVETLAAHPMATVYSGAPICPPDCRQTVDA